MSVKIFHKTSSEALIQAEKIANSIRQNKRTIPVLNQDGTITEDKIIFSKIDCSIIADNLAVMKIQWAKEYPYS
ncbi:hypothetical protein B1NLA3E_01240 [Bacillus sp. 1NLA3E]|nr:hypothetical protein B1NLA3E_01240 [Bacillus sp. 1NLA3E]